MITQFVVSPEWPMHLAMNLFQGRTDRRKCNTCRAEAATQLRETGQKIRPAIHDLMNE